MSKSIRILTAQNVYLEYELASLGDRAVAYLIDAGIKYAYLIALIWLLGVLRPFSTRSAIEEDLLWVVWIAGLLPFLVYDLFCEVVFQGQTIGKRTMKLRVVSVEGREQPLSGYLFRWLFRVVDFALFGPMVGLVAVSATPRSQRLGDLVGGTTVVSLKANRAARTAPTLPTFQDDYVVTFPNVTVLKDEEIQLIEQALRKSRASNNTALTELIARKLEEVLGTSHNLPPLEFIETVINDYKHITS